MKRPILSLAILALVVSACGAKPALWGTRPTPTVGANLRPAPTALRAIPTLTGKAASGAQAIPALPSKTPVVAQAGTDSIVTPTLLPTPDAPPILYYAQSGDTLPAVAARFGVKTTEITSAQTLPKTGLIDPGVLLVIPDRLDEYGPNAQVIPDSEVVFSTAAADFDTFAYVAEAGGELSKYREFLNSTGWETGAQIIDRLARENAINPRLLLAVLDYQGNWVTGTPGDFLKRTYPMGYEKEFKDGIFSQMVWAVNQLFAGYYGWRSGKLTDLTFRDDSTLRLAPDLNAGTVAVQYLFAQLYSQADWQRVMDPNTGFPAKYAEQFGDPWLRAQNVGPIFPPGLTAPTLVLPFEPNREWSLTSGPHGAWLVGGPLAAVDFAPSTDHPGCAESEKWIVAVAPGLVVRSGKGVVMLDLDGDGHEETGWNLLYLHVATKDRIELGAWVETDQRIGHASCEGGASTGTHLHFARKYNGEWVLADGPMPLVMSGYTIHEGKLPYEGTMTKGDVTIIANPVGTASSIIFRKSNE
ncbi:MAG: peptidoglycan DD-metalloendopeptidase family protein [Chloroflexota bacterium]